MNQYQKARKKALRAKPKLNTNKMDKHPEVVANHRAALKGTGFEECAPCGGCAPKTIQTVEGVVKMKCGNGGGELVGPDVAAACKGDRPPILQPKRHFLSVRASA